MVKLEPTRRKIPAKKVLIYLLLIFALILVLASWSRISLFMQTFFQFSN
jgi:DNA-binding transcriptional regulator of glucitol operon